MIYAPPVRYAFGELRMPVLPVIGDTDLGHSPQILAPARFHKALLHWL